MKSNREIATDAFNSWMDGSGYVTTIFAESMKWEIVGRSAASRKYPNKDVFVREVLQPFGARFTTDAPFRPIIIRGIYADDRLSVVTVIWDGEGTTVADTTYSNTYAWVMTFRDGMVIDGTAFYDSVTFNELWENVKPIA